MSSPWGPHGPSDPYGGPPPSHGGQELQPYGGGPVDPYGGQAAAPVPTYNPYVNPGSWEAAQYLPAQTVPGTIIGGSIVGYVMALFLFVEGLFLLFFGSVVGSFSDSNDFTDSGTSLVIGGIGNWITVGLLVAGGVIASLRRPAGLILVLAAAGLVLVLAVYWVAIAPYGFTVFWALVHVVIGLVPAGLVALPASNRAWLARQPGSGPPPRPAGPPPYPTDRYGRPFGS